MHVLTLGVIIDVSIKFSFWFTIVFGYLQIILFVYYSMLRLIVILVKFNCTREYYLFKNLQITQFNAFLMNQF
jgi:hypothetical protein